jgi:hypothetical protein
VNIRDETTIARGLTAIEARHKAKDNDFVLLSNSEDDSREKHNGLMNGQGEKQSRRSTLLFIDEQARAGTYLCRYFPFSSYEPGKTP